METMQKCVGKDVGVVLSNDAVIPKDVGGGFLFHLLCSSFSVVLKPGHILKKQSQTAYLNCNNRVQLRISYSICNQIHFIGLVAWFIFF